MGKIKAKSWSIFWFQNDDEPYHVGVEYLDADGTGHEISRDFKTYAQAYGWLSERVEL